MISHLKKSDIRVRQIYYTEKKSYIIIEMNNFKGMYKTGIFYDSRDNLANREITCMKSAGKYKSFIQGLNAGIELVGGVNQQTKPYFDTDPIEHKSIKLNEVEFCNKVVGEIKNMYKNKTVKCMKRPAFDDDGNVLREKGGKVRYSFRFIVQGVRISCKNQKKILQQHGYVDDKPFDMKVYNKSQGLYPIYTNKKMDQKTNSVIEVPELIPFDYFGMEDMSKINITDYWVSYIEEEYEDWDLKFTDEPVAGPKSLKDDMSVCDDGDDDTDKYSNINLQEVIAHLKPNRAHAYDSWISGMWAILNACDAKGHKRKQAYELADVFSSLDADKYDEDEVYDWLSTNYDKRRESGYRFKLLLDWLKDDDPDFYKKLFTPKKKLMPYHELKEEFEQTHCKIRHPCMIITQKKDKVIFESMESATKSYKDFQCTVEKPMPKGGTTIETIQFIDKWVKDCDLRVYDSYEFVPPPNVCDMEIYNTWSPFKIMKEPYDSNDIEYNESIINRLLEFGNNLLGETNFKYILARFAQRFQTPAKRTEVSVLLYSEEEGTAKNTLYNIMMNIFGMNYFQEVGSASYITEQHSTIEDGKLFILVNEAKAEDTKNNFDKLKDKITCPNLTLRPLYVQAFTVKNYNDYDWTSNNINCLKLTKNNRRFFAVETTTYYLGNKDFFKSFYDEIVNCPRALRVIAEYLLTFDVKTVVPSGNFQLDMPKTELMMEMIEHNKDYIVRFLEDGDTYKNTTLISENHTDKFISTKDVFRYWTYWCERCNIRNDYNTISFGSRLSRLIKRDKLEFIAKWDKSKAVSGYTIDQVKYAKYIGME